MHENTIKQHSILETFSSHKNLCAPERKTNSWLSTDFELHKGVLLSTAKIKLFCVCKWDVELCFHKLPNQNTLELDMENRIRKKERKGNQILTKYCVPGKSNIWNPVSGWCILFDCM